MGPTDRPERGLRASLKALIGRHSRSNSRSTSPVPSPALAQPIVPLPIQPLKPETTPTTHAINPSPKDPTSDCPKTPVVTVPQVVVSVHTKPPDASVTRRDLWEEAFNQLDEDTKSKLYDVKDIKTLAPAPISQQLSDLLVEVEEKRRICDEQTWKCTIRGSEIIIRDYAVKVMGGLAMAGDVAAEFMPGPAKVVWPFLKGIISATTANYAEQMGALLMCSERVVRVVTIGQIYEKSYRRGNASSEAVLLLEDDLLKLYQAALEILANARHLLSKSSCGQTMRSILFPHETSGLFSTLATCEAAISEAAQACSAEVDSQLLDMVHGPMVRLDRGVQALLEQEERDTIVDILNWISNIDYNAQHAFAKKKRTAGTCQWLLDRPEFRSWVDMSASSILCLKGSVGTGKTVLTSKVIDCFKENRRHSPQEAFAFFYCNQVERSRSHSTSILRSLIRQLSYSEFTTESLSIRKEIVSSYHSAQLLAKESIDEEDCPQQLLNSANMFAATTIVLDAFDECEKVSQYELIDVFERLVSESERPVKIFISSRPSEVQDLSWQCIWVEEQANRSDIQKFITAKLNANHTPRILKLLESEISTSLLSRSGSMFRWVELQLQQLGNCRSKESVLNRLKHMPRTLTETYDEIYKEIEELDEHDRALVDRAIMWAMCTRRPINGDELVDAVRIDTRNWGDEDHDGDDITEDELDHSKSWLATKVQQNALLSLCRNLLIIDQHWSGPVWRFPHLSVVEYFEHQRKDSGRPNRQMAEEYVSSACLRCLITFSDRREMKSEIGRFGTYIYFEWPKFIRSLEKRKDETIFESPTARMLKIFVGSPGESSEKYHRWFQVNPLQVQYEPYFESMPLGFQPAFVMAKLGIASLLKDWWHALRIPTTVSNEAGYGLLLQAVMSESVDILRHLVSKGLEVDSAPSVDTGHGSLLAIAASHGKYAIVKFLVEEAHATIDLPLSGGDYGSALEAACHGGHLNVVKYLVKKKPKTVNQNFSCGLYGSALAAAVIQDHYEVTKFLLDAGAEVNRPLNPVAQVWPLGRNFRSMSCGSVLTAAALNSDVSIVKLLTERGAEPDQTVGNGQFGSALAAASFRDHGLPTVQHLVEICGADVNKVLACGDFPNALFAARGYRGDVTESFAYLVDMGAEIKSLWSGLPTSALAQAACRGREKLLQDLIKTSSDEMKRRRTIQKGILAPLFKTALLRGGLHLLKTLIEAGADVNAPLWPVTAFRLDSLSNLGGNCLEIMAGLGMLEQIAFIVDECDARINLTTSQGIYGSALAAAVMNNQHLAVKLLLQKGADPNVCHDDAFPLRTPLMMAAYCGKHRCAEALLNAGADVNFYIKDSALYNALGAAEVECDLELFACLSWFRLFNQSYGGLDLRTNRMIRKHKKKTAVLLRRWQSLE